ncbi:MAG: hypothetical protein AAGF12_20685 [Myxococcota bacterium]
MLGWFASDFFARSPVLVFPLVGLGLFFTVFVTVSLRAVFTNKAKIERLAALPFEEPGESGERS